MNYLAHFWLTDAAKLPLAGAILGDLVRGRLEGKFPPALERSIRLHRRIDVLTDTHPLSLAARTEFAPGARRYAGILLDVLHDHCLARDWPRYSAEPLAEFAARAAQATAAESAGFARAGSSPPTAAQLRSLLLSYAEETGIERALARVASRLSKPEGLMTAARDWRLRIPALVSNLPDLLRDLRAAAMNFAAVA